MTQSLIETIEKMIKQKDQELDFLLNTKIALNEKIKSISKDLDQLQDLLNRSKSE